MNERAIELYRQALEFAYAHVGRDSADTARFSGTASGRLVELTVQAAADLLEVEYGQSALTGNAAARAVRQHFGVD